MLRLPLVFDVVLDRIWRLVGEILARDNSGHGGLVVSKAVVAYEVRRRRAQLGGCDLDAEHGGGMLVRDRRIVVRADRPGLRRPQYMNDLLPRHEVSVALDEAAGDLVDEVAW